MVMKVRPFNMVGKLKEGAINNKQIKETRKTYIRIGLCPIKISNLLFGRRTTIKPPKRLPSTCGVMLGQIGQSGILCKRMEVRRLEGKIRIS